MAFILAFSGAVPFSYFEMMFWGLSEKAISVFWGGVPWFASNIEVIIQLFVLVSINVFSNCSIKGKKKLSLIARGVFSLAEVGIYFLLGKCFLKYCNKIFKACIWNLDKSLICWLNEIPKIRIWIFFLH